MLAYYEGYAYCRDGGYMDDCPFPKKSRKGKLWIKGFEDCANNLDLQSYVEVDKIENNIKDDL